MKRPSYRHAIDWIAQNDDPGLGDDSLDPRLVSELVSSSLIADIFEVDANKVGRDVVRRRKAIAKFERSES